MRNEKRTPGFGEGHPETSRSVPWTRRMPTSVCGCVPHIDQDPTLKTGLSSRESLLGSSPSLTNHGLRTYRTRLLSSSTQIVTSSAIVGPLRGRLTAESLVAIKLGDSPLAVAASLAVHAYICDRGRRGFTKSIRTSHCSKE